MVHDVSGSAERQSASSPLRQVANWQHANIGRDIVALWHCEADNRTNDRHVGIIIRPTSPAASTSPVFLAISRLVLGISMALKLGRRA